MFEGWSFTASEGAKPSQAKMAEGIFYSQKWAKMNIKERSGLDGVNKLTFLTISPILEPRMDDKRY